MASQRKIWLIRHGEGMHNATGRHDQRDPLLTDKGREQAAALRGHESLVGCELVVVSPMSRAVQTAAAIFGEQPPCRVALSPLCSERFSGMCDAGRPKSQLCAAFPFVVAWDGFGDLPEEWTHTKDSDVEWFEERVPAFLTWLRAQPERCIAVVGHGCFFQALIGRYLTNCEVGQMLDVQWLVKTILSDAPVRERCLAAEALVPSAVVCREELEAMLRDVEPEIRGHAARVLGLIGRWMTNPIKRASIADKVSPLLDDPDVFVRSRASEALGELGEASAHFVQSMGKLLHDSDQDVRLNAAWALGRMLKGYTVPPEAQQQNVNDGKKGLTRKRPAATDSWSEKRKTMLKRACAPEVVQLLQPKRRRSHQGGIHAFIEKLASMLKIPDPNVQWYVIEALGLIGQAAASCASRVLTFLQDPDVEIRQIAAWTIGQFRTTDRHHARSLEMLLQDPDASVRYNATEALGDMGQIAGEQSKKMLTLLQDPDAQVRQIAIASLRKLGKSEEALSMAASRSLYSDDAVVRQIAVETLGAMDADASTLKDLERLLQDPDPCVRASVVTVLGKNVATFKLFEEKVCGLLKDPEPVVRLAVVQVLGEMGCSAMSHADAVKDLLEDQTPDVRALAAIALVRLENRRSDSLEELGKQAATVAENAQ